MAGDDGALTRVDLVNQEWARELGRKDSLERRGITVITASGVLVTLIFAFSTAVAKGQHFGNFSLWEKVLLAVALAFFLLSGVFGIATNRPRNYGILKIDSLRANKAAPNERVSEETLSEMIAVIVTTRHSNDNKAIALSWSISMQVCALVLIGITIMAVVI